MIDETLDNANPGDTTDIAPSEEQAQAPPIQQSVHEVALECIAGRWGRGQARKARLRNHGHDANAVLEEVNKIFKGSSSQQEVNYGAKHSKEYQEDFGA